MPAPDYVKEFPLAIDTMKDTSSQNMATIMFKQGDFNIAVLSITVSHDGTVMDLTGATVQLEFLKPDKTIVLQDDTSGVTVTEATTGSVKVALRSQVLASLGKVSGQLTITYPNVDSTLNKVFKTNQFSIVIDYSIDSDGAIQSLNDAPVIQKAIDAGTMLMDVNLQTIVDNTANVNTMQTQLSNANITQVMYKDMLPSMYVVSLDGLTIGNIVLTRNPIKLGAGLITLA